MKSRLLLLALLPLLLGAITWQTAEPGYQFTFPRDHFSHPAYQTEWWYYTGNLRAPDGHRYGFELTFFRQAQQITPQMLASEPLVWRPDQIYLAHLALSDIDGHSFFHTERLHRAGPGLAGAAFNDQRFWNGNWQVRWLALDTARQQLTAVVDGFTLDLVLDPLKRPVIQGQNGISRKGPTPGEASHYISFTRMAARGTLKRNRTQVALNGFAWMDHEFFTEPPRRDLTGWDWFSIQLSNNEELMLYRLRGAHGETTPFSSGSYVDANGTEHFLRAKDFSLEPGATWRSPHTGARYPIAWTLLVPALGLTLHAQTDLHDQELASENSTSPSYWEGSVRYSGTLRGKPASGLGYLEMTGYTHAINLSGAAGFQK